MFVALQHLGTTLRDQSSAVWGAVQTQGRNIAPFPKYPADFEHGIRLQEYADRCKGNVQGNRRTLLRPTRSWHIMGLPHINNLWPRALQDLLFTLVTTLTYMATSTFSVFHVIKWQQQISAAIKHIDSSSRCWQRAQDPEGQEHLSSPKLNPEHSFSSVSFSIHFTCQGPRCRLHILQHLCWPAPHKTEAWKSSMMIAWEQNENPLRRVGFEAGVCFGRFCFGLVLGVSGGDGGVWLFVLLFCLL